MQTLDARLEPLERVVEACAQVIFAGGTIAFPSDTSYCVGRDPYRIGDLEAEAMVIASPAEFLEYAPGNPLAILASKRLLPGPVTLLVRESALGLRVPDEPLARAIADATGPLAVSDVNRTKIQPDLSIENGPTRYDREASIVDLTGRYARLVREGALPYDRLAALVPVQ